MLGTKRGKIVRADWLLPVEGLEVWKEMIFCLNSSYSSFFPLFFTAFFFNVIYQFCFWHDSVCIFFHDTLHIFSLCYFSIFVMSITFTILIITIFMSHNNDYCECAYCVIMIFLGPCIIVIRYDISSLLSSSLESSLSSLLFLLRSWW